MLKEFELYFQCNSLSVILIDSVYEKDKSYYTQAFLKECKYVVKEKRTPKFITDNRSFSL